MNPKILYELYKWLLGAAKVEEVVPKYVLIVEDMPNDAELAKIIVEKQGYRAIVRGTLSTALVALKDFPWKCIFVDMNLGNPVTRGGTLVMEGTIFVQEAVRILPDVNIVFMTGSATSLEGNQDTASFPCIIKGNDNTRFDKAMSAMLKNGKHEEKEIKTKRLFWLTLFLCLACILIGMLLERYKLIKFIS